MNHAAEKPRELTRILLEPTTLQNRIAEKILRGDIPDGAKIKADVGPGELSADGRGEAEAHHPESEKSELGHGPYSAPPAA